MGAYVEPAAGGAENGKAATTVSLSPWADAVAAGYANAGKPVLLSDMGQCRPATALSTGLKVGRWKLMCYELADGTRGRMVWASPEARAPELRLPLGVTGPHAVFIGLFNGGISCETLVRLERERIPQLRAVGKGGEWNRVEEVFYRVADLDGGSLCFGPNPLAGSLLPGSTLAGCGVAYVKLIPLSPGEQVAWRAERFGKRPRNQAATVDGLGILYNRPASQATAESLLGILDGFRDTGFGTLLLQYGGADQVPYPSQVANRFGAYAEEKAYPESPGYRLYAESFRAFAEKKINPYRVLIDGGHELGMTVQVSVRPAMWTFWEPYPDFFESPFYREHPEWRTVDRDGSPVTRMSWAVPQVRAHVIQVIQEAVQLGADGANVLFNRGMPVVLYEPAFVALFQKEYGEDPRKVAETDPRITKVRSDVIATFMRELRAMLDGEARRRGTDKKLVLSASCFGNEEDNLHFGLDMRRLVNERLVDEIYPYKWDHGAKRREWDIRSFSVFCRPRGVKLSPILTSGYEFETQVRDALSFYAEGADSISYWDANGMWRDMRQWTVMSRMDHVKELEARGPVPAAVSVAIHMLNGQILDGRYPPYMGG